MNTLNSIEEKALKTQKKFGKTKEKKKKEKKPGEGVRNSKATA